MPKKFIFNGESNLFQTLNFKKLKEFCKKHKFDLLILIENNQPNRYSIKNLYTEINVDDNTTLYDTIFNYFKTILNELDTYNSSCSIYINGYYEDNAKTPYMYLISKDVNGFIECSEYCLDRYSDIVLNKGYHDGELIISDYENNYYDKLTPCFLPVIEEWVQYDNKKSMTNEDNNI